VDIYTDSMSLTLISLFMRNCNGVLIRLEEGFILPVPFPSGREKKRRRRVSYLRALLAATSIVFSISAKVQAASQQKPLYMQAGVAVEKWVDDLLRRMTIEEKVRQLDMYSSAREVVSAHTDNTHAALDAVFVPEKALAVWGHLGVGAVQDLNPTPNRPTPSRSG
jgi:hypothetical protein